MAEAESKGPDKPHRRFWKKKRWWLLAVLLGGLVWLDGPGWKWIARLAADHYLPDLGYEADFDLEGRLSSGRIGLSGVRLSSDTTIQVAGLEQLELRYLLSRVVRGEVESVELDGLHVEVDLAASPPSPEEEKDEPSEPADPVELLGSIRQRLVPMNLQLRDLSAVIRRGDELVYSIEPTTIRHEPGDDTFELDLGAMRLPGGRELSAQTTTIDWSPDRLLLDRLKLLEEASIVSLEAEIGEPFRFRTDLLVADSRFEAETDLDEAALRLSEGNLTADEIARVAGIELPLKATIRTLDIRADEVGGGLETITGDVKLGLAGVDFDGWTADELTLQAALREEASATLEGIALGSPVTLTAGAQLDRANALLPTRATATLDSPRLQPALTYLRDRFKPDADAPPPPDATLKLTAESDFTDGIPDDARATLDLASGDAAPPLSLKAGWKDETVVIEALTAPGLRVEGDFATGSLTYRGDARLEDFLPASLAPWAAPWGVAIPEGITASLSWTGEGNLQETEHEGQLEVREVVWVRDEETGPIKAFANGSYDWPGSVVLDSLNVQHDAQKIESRLELADQVLSLEKLHWSDGDDVLAEGSGKIPVPEDPADWKALLRETRPIHLDLKTPELPLSKLHPFLPADVRFADASRARLEVDIDGTPAAPELVAKLRAKSLGLVSQPDIPLANLELDAVGRNQTLKVDGDVLTEAYPPAKISLVTNWDPDQWAEDPETVKAAKLDAGVSITDLNLATLASFVPDARILEGSLNAEVRVGGTVGEPEPRAEVRLEGGTLRMQNPDLPRISRGTVRVSATDKQVTIETIAAEISAGTLEITGTVALDGWKPSTLDIRLDGDSLPAVRNESMIVRLDADLSLAGPWETARLSGDVGVVDSLFFKDIELLPIGEPLTTVAEPSLPAVDAPPPGELTAKIPEPFVNWGLDLDLKTRPEAPFLIRGNLAKGEVYLDARVRGTVGNPRPSGEAKLREIVAQLPFSTLEIKSGAVKLRPDHPFDPVLDFRGTSRIRPYDVTIYVYGPVSNPKIQPTSSPPLPETEIMTLIATGTTTEGLADPNAATARATQLLIEEARRGRIGAVRALQPVFRVLDKLEFQVGEADPYTSKKFNSVSFDLDENWVLTAGISEEGNTRTKVTYLFRFR